MAERREILVDRWYIPADKLHHPRWVLSLFVNEADGRERVLYSDGGVVHHCCLRSTFSVWIGSKKARLADGSECNETLWTPNRDATRGASGESDHGS